MLISQAGKEILLKVVAQSIYVYLYSLFLLPKAICFKLESMFNRFLWCRRGSYDQYLHWCSWVKLCWPKELGVLGFRRLHEFNLVMLGK